MQTTSLSDAALALFRLHIHSHDNVMIDDANCDPYRELERAGLMVLGNSFRDGPGTIYRVSKLGFERKAELLSRAKASAR
jgi:hypothetical protein